MSDSVSHTMTLTDIASGWTECVALAEKDSGLVVDGLGRMAATMRFPHQGIDTDSESEFRTASALALCQNQNVEFTRSRTSVCEFPTLLERLPALLQVAQQDACWR